MPPAIAVFLAVNPEGAATASIGPEAAKYSLENPGSASLVDQAVQLIRGRHLGFTRPLQLTWRAGEGWDMGQATSVKLALQAAGYVVNRVEELPAAADGRRGRDRRRRHRRSN